MAELKERQKLFCQEYIKDLNGTAAAIRAGYSEKTAYAIAAENLKKPQITAYIQELTEGRNERTQIDADKVITELAAIAFSDIRDYISLESGELKFKDSKDWTDTQAKAVEGIKFGKFGMELKLHGKSWSLDMIAKHIGFYEKHNSQTGQLVANVILGDFDKLD